MYRKSFLTIKEIKKVGIKVSTIEEYYNDNSGNDEFAAAWIEKWTKHIAFCSKSVVEKLSKYFNIITLEDFKKQKPPVFPITWIISIFWKQSTDNNFTRLKWLPDQFNSKGLIFENGWRREIIINNKNLLPVIIMSDRKERHTYKKKFIRDDGKEFYEDKIWDYTIEELIAEEKKLYAEIRDIRGLLNAHRNLFNKKK